MSPPRAAPAGDCLFCRISSGAAPASIVHADDRAVVFMDLNQMTAGHMLVAPRQHAALVAELPPDLQAHLFVTAVRAGEALRRSGLPCDAVRLQLNDGAAAGQDQPHVHLHVIARFFGDAYYRGEGRRLPPRHELDELARRLATAWPPDPTTE